MPAAMRTISTRTETTTSISVKPRVRCLSFIVPCCLAKRGNVRGLRVSAHQRADPVLHPHLHAPFIGIDRHSVLQKNRRDGDLALEIRKWLSVRTKLNGRSIVGGVENAVGPCLQGLRHAVSENPYSRCGRLVLNRAEGNCARVASGKNTLDHLLGLMPRNGILFRELDDLKAAREDSDH